MKKSLLALAALATTLTALPTTSALADPPSWANAHGRRDQDRNDNRGRDRYDRRDNTRNNDRYDNRYNSRDNRNRQNIYDSRGRYAEPRRVTRDSYLWRGNDGRYYCKRDNGTTGLIIGAGVGALAGNQIAGSGNRTIGTVLGGVLGGVLGRQIDKGDLQCR